MEQWKIIADLALVYKGGTESLEFSFNSGLGEEGGLRRVEVKAHAAWAACALRVRVRK